MESYEKIKKVLALGFMNFLDENRPKDKMCLSNGECADIEKAFNEKDWPKLARYLDKYTESEDERIRKEIIDYLGLVGKGDGDYAQPMIDRWISYLEKQKEQKPNYCHHEVDETGWTEEYRKAYYDGWNNCNMQHEQLKAGHKPAEWSDEEKQKLNRIYVILGQAADTHAFSTTCRLIGDKEAVELQDFIRSIAKPQAQEWSGEDERILKGIIGKIDHDQTYGVSKDEMLNFLKKL